MKKLCAVKGKLFKVVSDCRSIAYSAMAQYDDEKKDKVVKKTLKIANAIISVFIISCMVGTVFATGGGTKDPAGTVLNSMIDIICKVFKYVGVILAVYSIGQLVMAFKNEDADSKSRATTMLVVACVLIGIETLVNSTKIKSYLS